MRRRRAACDDDVQNRTHVGRAEIFIGEKCRQVIIHITHPCVGHVRDETSIVFIMYIYMRYEPLNEKKVRKIYYCIRVLSITSSEAVFSFYPTKDYGPYVYAQNNIHIYGGYNTVRLRVRFPVCDPIGQCGFSS